MPIAPIDPNQKAQPSGGGGRPPDAVSFKLTDMLNGKIPFDAKYISQTYTNGSSEQMTLADQVLSANGYKPLNGNDNAGTAWLLANHGSDTYLQTLLKGGDWQGQMISEATGLSADKITSQMRSQFSDSFGTWQTGVDSSKAYNLSDFKSAYANSNFGSTAISDVLAQQKSDADTAKQKSDTAQNVKDFTSDPNNPWNVLQQQQTGQLQTNLGLQQTESIQRLINQLAAQGIDPSGGAFAGGSAQINKDISNVLGQGLSSIGTTTTQGIAGEAQNLAQQGTGYTQANRASSYNDIATQLSNQYQQDMATKYAAAMQQYANANNGSIFDVLGTAAGGAVGLATGGAAGANTGMQLGSAGGKLLNKLFTGGR